MRTHSTPFPILSRRWAPEVLLTLAGETKRFTFLLSRIEGISDRVLTQRLRDLEEAGLIRRDVEAGPPVKVFYSLTKAGEHYLEPLGHLAVL